MPKHRLLAAFRTWIAPALGARNRADVLTVVLVATVAFLAYFPARSDDRVAVTAPPVGLLSSTGDIPGAGAPTPAPMTLVDRVRRLQLRDVYGALAAPGRVVGNVVAADPGGSMAYRLQLAMAFLGAVTVAVLVAIMRRLDIARTAAIASALGFAFHQHTWSHAVTPDSRMGSMPVLALSVLALLLWGDARRARLLWLALGLWLLSIAAQPSLLCTAPAVAWFVYVLSRREFHRAFPPAATGMLLFGILLAVAGVGLVARAGAFDARRVYDSFSSELGLLGFLFLSVGLINHLWRRQTPQTSLLSLSLAGIAGWLSIAGTPDTQQLQTALLLACPIIGHGMSVVVGSRPGRTHAVSSAAVLLVFPATNVVSHRDTVDEARNGNALNVLYARSLAAVLPDRGAVAVLQGTQEPLPRLWPISPSDGLRIVDLPWDIRRIRDLAATGQTFALEPTRTRLAFLGFRFDEPVPIHVATPLDTYLKRLPRGTIVAAVAGRDTVSRARLLLERTVWFIGGGQQHSIGRDHFYGLVGLAGRAAIVEESDPRGVELRLEAGHVLDDDGRLLPATLQLESARRRARIDVNGNSVLAIAEGIGIVVLRSDGAVERIAVAFEHDDELWVPVGAGPLSVARLAEWQPCMLVGTDQWLDVSGLLTGSGAGVVFSSQSPATSLALYAWKDDQRLLLRQAGSSPPSAGFTFETFDRSVPAESLVLDRLLDFDGLASDHRIRRQRFVQLLQVDSPENEPPLTAIRFSGTAASGVARLLGPAGAPRVTICGAR